MSSSGSSSNSSAGASIQPPNTQFNANVASALSGSGVALGSFTQSASPPAAVPGLVSSPPGFPQAPFVNPYQKYVDMFTESCITKALISGGVGFLMGMGLGAFALSWEMQQNEARVKVWEGFKQMGKKSYALGKNFGSVGLVFSGIECVVEKERGTHDHWNGLIAGCASGAVFGVKSGPKGMAIGCAGFAAFSAVMERVFQSDTFGPPKYHHVERPSP
ncbi:mitochondrial TIM22 translocase of inner membrane Tim22 subunit [Andalucia godoyi]|uniref:Mitochondrial import inner membrane translocase subunit TIM22 n=1 Tax=Andalucia godoyi TaxID=505711 RepID=A0A8K0AK55_ANDGO|nr:mitochondrial TIM22 translocase of inner membrane Tim22 subunit [Andalucia godoyi]|eukprot:ANDGO_05339.mRNA.1 mitochondrial TIM22 translocase of inner membrane Tim22 subunit